jgi:hypothetical protein
MVSRLSHRLAILSAGVLMISCGGGTETVPVQQVRITLEPVSLVATVERLVLRMRPTVLERADGSTNSVLTDNQGNNQQRDNCTRNLDGSYSCSSNGFQSFVDIYPIDSIGRPDRPLGWGLLATDHAVPQGLYTAITISAIHERDRRDSYVILSDGRECEIELRASDGTVAITFLTKHQIVADQDWHFKLRIDLNSADIEASQCENGFMLRALPVDVDAVTYQPS